MLLSSDIATELKESLESETLFSIFGVIPVTTACVVTWIIMAVLVIASLILTRNLKLIPDKKQMILESFIGWMRDFFKSILGERGMCYFPWLATVMMYIGFSNIIGLFGFTPPTKDFNVTVGLALTSIVLIEAAGIRARGAKGWIKSFAKPVAIVAPLNVLEIIIRPLSLCMRLFGNVLGAFIVMELIDCICPVILPLPFSAYFDIFDGFLQAYVFVFLTSLFIQESIEVD